jgi:hypothetical protein
MSEAILGELRLKMAHEIDKISKTTTSQTFRCKKCAVAWSGLTDRDVKYLSSEGRCHGEEDRWHRCQFSGVHCLGQAGHEECIPLRSSLDWTDEEYGLYRKERVEEDDI